MKAFQLTVLFVIMASFQPAEMEAQGNVSDTMEPRYSCPEQDVDFQWHDIGFIDDIISWQNCGMCVFAFDAIQLLNICSEATLTLFEYINIICLQFQEKFALSLRLASFGRIMMGQILHTITDVTLNHLTLA